VLGTAGCVGLWGYLLYQGVVDPLGGVKSLWPLFGISNQMLAAVALVLGTVVLVKMKRTKYIWVTVVPALWLLLCTTWALGLKLFSTNPQLEGFFFMANQYKEKIAAGGAADRAADCQHEPYRGEQLHQRRSEYSVPGGGVQHHLLRHQNLAERA
jgi:carbon starvation protein CstA